MKGHELLEGNKSFFLGIQRKELGLVQTLTRVLCKAQFPACIHSAAQSPSTTHTGCFSGIGDWHNYDLHSVQDWPGAKTGSWLFRHTYTSSLVVTVVIGRRHRKLCRLEASLKTWMFGVGSGNAVQ